MAAPTRRAAPPVKGPRGRCQPEAKRDQADTTTVVCAKPSYQTVFRGVLQLPAILKAKHPRLTTMYPHRSAITTCQNAPNAPSPPHPQPCYCMHGGRCILRCASEYIFRRLAWTVACRGAQQHTQHPGQPHPELASEVARMRSRNPK